MPISVGIATGRLTQTLVFELDRYLKTYALSGIVPPRNQG